jgi:hypothetical protein
MPHVLASGALELELLVLFSRSHDCICSSSPIKMMIGFVFDVQPCKNMELFRVLFALSAQKHAKQRPALSGQQWPRYLTTQVYTLTLTCYPRQHMYWLQG